MFYQLFSLLQLLGIIWFNMLLGTDVSVSTNIPSQMNPGDEIVAEITINKGSIVGFVKFQQDFPEGFLVSELDSKGGNFSFTENSLKIVWISFPSENEVKIKYKLSVLSNSKGVKTINGKLAYLDNNDKKVVTLSPISLNIETSGPAVSDEKTSTENNPVQTTSATNNVKNINSEKTIPSTNNDNRTNNESNGPIKCNREIINVNSTEVLVKFTVDNTAGLKGFAKLEDVIPMGFNVKLVQSKGSSFSFINQKVRILWLEMPTTPIFSCSYKIIKAEADANSIDLEGLFSYLNDGKGVSVQIMTPGIEFKENPNAAQEIAAAIPPKSESTQKLESQKKARELKENPTVAKDIAATIPPKSESKQKPETQNKTSEPIAAGSSNESSNYAKNSNSGSPSGIIYKVQVCALRNVSSADAVAKELQLNESLDLEMHNGWHKFTFGNFSTYALAKEKRNEKSNLSTNPFVTSYNNGNRITVQEGLMISNQTWLK